MEYLEHLAKWLVSAEYAQQASQDRRIQSICHKIEVALADKRHDLPPQLLQNGFPLAASNPACLMQPKTCRSHSKSESYFLTLLQACIPAVGLSMQCMCQDILRAWLGVQGQVCGE